MPDTILVVGGSGFAGRMHLTVYARLGWTTRTVDPRDETASRPEGDLADYIVDLCTPTATHAGMLLDYYERGVRRFIVEKPQAADADEWFRCRAKTPGAVVFSVHNYLWSQAFLSGLDVIGDVVTFDTAFDKDRRVDDWNGRGAHDGNLAHVLQVEAPHQFAMASWIWPDLEVSSVIVDGNRYRTPDKYTPATATVSVRSDRCVGQITSNLRGPLRRQMTLGAADGRAVRIDFSPGGLLPAQTMTLNGDGGPGRVIWEGPDDALGLNLQAAVLGFDAQRPDPRLGEQHSAVVLRMLDDAMAADCLCAVASTA